MRLTHFSFSSVPSPTARPIPFFILSTQPTKTKQKREHRIPSSLAYFLVTSKRDCCHCHRSLSLSLLNVLFCFFSSYHKTFFFCFFFSSTGQPPTTKNKTAGKKRTQSSFVLCLLLVKWNVCFRKDKSQTRNSKLLFILSKVGGGGNHFEWGYLFSFWNVLPPGWEYLTTRPAQCPSN